MALSEGRLKILVRKIKIHFAGVEHMNKHTQVSFNLLLLRG